MSQNENIVPEQSAQEEYVYESGESVPETTDMPESSSTIQPQPSIEPQRPQKSRPLTFVEKVKRRMEQFAFDITQDDEKR